MATSNNLRVDEICVEACERDLVDTAGLAILMRFMSKTGFFRLCDNRLISNMLDFDACAITGSKKCDVKMYTGERVIRRSSTTSA